MKKEYVTPMMAGERFAPNEYVAACGDSGKVYLFKCDAGGGAYGGAWKETNGVSDLQINDYWDWDSFSYIAADKRITRTNSSYHACGKEHEASTTDDFIQNCYYRNASTGEVIPVVVWRGSDGNNVHCTTKLNMSEWETAKS